MISGGGLKEFKGTIKDLGMSQLIIMNTIALQMSPGFQKCNIYNATLSISKSGVLSGTFRRLKGGHKELWYTCNFLPHFCTPAFYSSYKLSKKINYIQKCSEIMVF